MFIVIFIVTILILVLVHELGHFLSAKKFNIKVLEFGFGIPPKLWGKKFGETIYSLNWLPFGGFVRLLGEDEVDKVVLENERSFARATLKKRVLVVIGGVLMNLLLAFLLFYIVLGAKGFKTELQLLIPYQFSGVSQSNEKIIIIAEVAKNSPGESSGIKIGDRVLTFNGQLVKDSADLISQTKQFSGQKVKLTLSDSTKSTFRTVEIIPREKPPQGEGPLGVGLATFEIAHLEYKDFWQKALVGPIHSFNVTIYSWQILSKTIAFSFQKKDFTAISSQVAGPIGITSIVKEIVSIKNPLLPYLDFMAILSLNLAIVNILPFPGLDGGRLLFLTIEAITRKKIHTAMEKYIHAVGLAILLTLIILITISDIQKIF